LPLLRLIPAFIYNAKIFSLHWHWPHLRLETLWYRARCRLWTSKNTSWFVCSTLCVLLEFTIHIFM
jgi:hypothetical protein